MNPTTKSVRTPDISEKRPRCFVIQPFGQKPLPTSGTTVDNDKIYDALRGLETIRAACPIIVFRANTTDVRAPDLHRHVVECIRGADCCVADFTGQNPNVIYEAGVAKGLGLEVVVICQDRADIPTDLQGMVSVFYKTEELEYIPNDIDKHLDRVMESVKVLRGERHPLVPYFSSRSDRVVREKIRTAEAKIDILQTNLASVHIGYLEDLTDALKEHDELEVRILTLNPQSIFVNFRGKQIGHRRDVALYRAELHSALLGVYLGLREYGQRVRMRIYDDLPTQIAFFFDSEVLVSVVSAIERSRANCAFLVPVGLPGASRTFVEHFDHLWNNNSMEFDPEPLTSA